MAGSEKVAIVTGGGRGLGREYGQFFCEDGDAVVLCDVNEAVTEVAEELRSKGGRALGIVTDITDEESVRSMVAKAIAEFGRVDVLVNNAGIWGDLEMAPLATIERSYWDMVIGVNLTGSLLCAQAVIPSMAEQGFGRIVNISSMGAYMASGVYSVTKLAVANLTYSLSAEVASRGITVNCVAPGPMDNDTNQAKLGEAVIGMLAAQTHSQRAGTARDLYDAIRYFASEGAGWVTGQTLLVNGGFSARF